MWKDKQRRRRRRGGGWTKAARTKIPSVNSRSSVSVFEIKQGAKVCLRGRKGEEVREREREGTGRAKAEACVGQSAASEKSLMHPEPLYKYHKEWMMSRGRGERRGRDRMRPFYRKTAFAGLGGKIDAAQSDEEAAAAAAAAAGAVLPKANGLGMAHPPTPPPAVKKLSNDWSQC